MNKRKAEWIAINGGGVVYHNHLYGIQQVNKNSDTCTLISLPYDWLVLNVPLDQIIKEEDYDWENDN